MGQRPGPAHVVLVAHDDDLAARVGVPHHAESQMHSGALQSETVSERAKEWQQKLLDLKLTDRAKDRFIEQLIPSQARRAGLLYQRLRRDEPATTVPPRPTIRCRAALNS